MTPRDGQLVTHNTCVTYNYLLYLAHRNATGNTEMKYANPWHKRGSESPAIYDRDHSKVVVKTECGRGLIIKVTNGCYDYVINGKVVTQLYGAADADAWQASRSDSRRSRAKRLYRDSI